MTEIAGRARHLPFAAGTLRMGLAPIPESAWLGIDETFTEQMQAKAALLATRRDVVLRHLPGSEPAAREALALVQANLALHHPGQDGDPFGPPDAHPLEIAARLAQEGLCILESGEGGYRLTAGCVCFPSNWSLAEKLGQPLRMIHAPVPGFEPKLATPVDRLFERLQPDHIVARFNWLIHDTPELHQVGRHPSPDPIAPDEAGDRLWLRVERQTLRRLPLSGAVLFTIRTHVHRLRDAIVTPASAAELAGALRAMSPALASYRHMSRIGPPLLIWLDARARP